MQGSNDKQTILDTTTQVLCQHDRNPPLVRRSENCKMDEEMRTRDQSRVSLRPAHGKHKVRGLSKNA